jgi:hypothetical protein
MAEGELEEGKIPGAHQTSTVAADGFVSGALKSKGMHRRPCRGGSGRRGLL